MADQHWDFGDGATSTEISPTHTFEAVGHYTVTLTITATDGITDVEVKPAYVTVSPEPSEPYLDLDQDGYVDLVVSNYRDDSGCNTCYYTDSYIYWGRATGYDEAERNELPTMGAFANAVADLNNDGYLDIVFANHYNGGYNLDSYIYWGDGSRDGFSAANRTELATHGARGVAVADLNGDGYLEVVLANYYDGDNYVYSYIYWGSVQGYSESNRSALPMYRASGVDVADLDEDGYLDLVFSSYYDGNYSTNSYIYWGSATGYSTLDRTSVSTYGAMDVAAVDLDADDYLDLVFASYYDGNYSTNSYIYWGDGSRDGFSSSQRTDLPTYGAYSAAVADFNRDGHLDVAFANYYNGSNYDINSYIYWGSNSGFSQTVKLELPTERTIGAVAADLDGDGWPELLFSQSYDAAAGTYQAPNRIYWNSPVGFNTTNVSRLPGWSSYGFGAVLPPTEHSNHTFGRVLSPYGQPKADFQVSTGSSVRGTGALTTTFDNLSSPASQLDDQHWDFGDGATSTEISPTHTFEAVGHYTVTLTITSTEGITDVESKPAYVTVSPEPVEPFVDLDRDGYVDLVVSNYRDNSGCSGCVYVDSYIYWGSATGHDETNRTELETVGSLGNAVADLNNDGYLDLVFASHYDGNHSTNSYIYWGDGTRTGFSNSNRTELANQGGFGLAVADLDGNGYQDLVFPGYHNGSNSYWTNSYIYWGGVSGYSAEARTGLWTYGSLAVDVADLNEDGYLDLVFASSPSDGAYSYIFWGSATGYSALDRTDMYTRNAYDVAVVDLDGDGHLDLVYANNDGGDSASYIYWGNGQKGGFSTSNRTDLPTRNARGVAVADYDRDGHLDVAFVNYSDGSSYDINSYVYWGDGTQTGFSESERQVLPTSRASGILAADLNGDGWLELLFGQEYNNAASSYQVENRVYWNSPAGFNTTNVSTISGWHTYALGAVLPITDHSNFSFGQSVVNPLRFATDTQFGSIPLTVTFTNLASPELTWDSFTWGFGDGTTGTEISPTHTYTQAGLYTVILQGIAGSETYNVIGENRVIATSGPSLMTPGRPLAATSTAAGQLGDAIDQNLYTHWLSSGSNGAWLRVDLGRAHTINEFLLSWRWNESLGQPATALIQVSLDGNNWETVYTDTLTAALNGSPRFITPSVPAHGRYVRFYGQTLYGSQVALNEFQAFGDIAIDAEKSTLVSTPGSFTADGLETTTLTATLVSSDDQPIANWPVSLAVSGSNNLINGQPVQANTWFDIGYSDSQGLITATLASTEAGDKVVQARTKTFLFSQPVTMTFTPGAADPGQSRVEVFGPATAAADGLDTVQIRVTARDEFSNPISGTTVVLTSTATAVSFSQPPLTDQEGQADGYITGNQVGVFEVGALANGLLISDTVSVTFEGADLRVTKTKLEPSQAYATFPVTYTLSVENIGPLTATGVVITDVLPPELTFVRQDSGLTFDEATLTWQAGNLGPDEEININLTAQVANGVTQVTNVASATTTAVELFTGNNSDDVSHSVAAPQPVLALSPGSPSLAVAPGQSQTVNLTLGNIGQLPMSGLVVTGPTVMPWVTITPASLPDLSPGQQTIITLTAAPPTTTLVGTYRDFVIATEASGGEQRAILRVDVLPTTRDLQLTFVNTPEGTGNQGQTVPGAVIELFSGGALVDVTPAFTNYVDVYRSGSSNANTPEGTGGVLVFYDLPVGEYQYSTISAPDHDPLNGGQLDVVEGAGLQTEIFTLAGRPRLALTPNASLLVVAPDETASQEFTIVNNGAAPLTGLNVDTGVLPGWAYLGGGALPASLQPHESYKFVLFASPTVTDAGEIHRGYLTVTADGGQEQQASVTLQVTYANTRDMDLTATGSGGQPIAGGTITLIRQEASLQFTQGVTQTLPRALHRAHGQQRRGQLRRSAAGPL